MDIFNDRTLSEMTFFILALTFQSEGPNETVSSREHLITAVETLLFLCNFALSAAGIGKSVSLYSHSQNSESGM